MTATVIKYSAIYVDSKGLSPSTTGFCCIMQITLVVTKKLPETRTNTDLKEVEM